MCSFQINLVEGFAVSEAQIFGLQFFMTLFGCSGRTCNVLNVNLIGFDPVFSLLIMRALRI